MQQCKCVTTNNACDYELEVSCISVSTVSVSSPNIHRCYYCWSASSMYEIYNIFFEIFLCSFLPFPPLLFYFQISNSKFKPLSLLSALTNCKKKKWKWVQRLTWRETVWMYWICLIENARDLFFLVVFWNIMETYFQFTIHLHQMTTFPPPTFVPL